MAARILLVDDHELIREGLRLILSSHGDWEICGEAIDGQDAVEKAEHLKPDLVVLDLYMPRLDGFQATRRILAENPRQKILILSMHDSPGLVLFVAQSGAQGFARKTSGSNELLTAIENILAGGQFFPAACVGPPTPTSQVC
jgi:DNA-binding NarL/FixJ family response regulator